jgi:hypothetical protein
MKAAQLTKLASTVLILLITAIVVFWTKEELTSLKAKEFELKQRLSLLHDEIAALRVALAANSEKERSLRANLHGLRPEASESHKDE